MESYSVDSIGRSLLISSILNMLLTTLNFSWDDLKPTSIFLPWSSQFSHSRSMVPRALLKGEFLRRTVLVRWY